MRDNRTAMIVILGILVILGVVGYVVFSGSKTAVTVQPAQVADEIEAADTQIPDTPKTEDGKTEDSGAETTDLEAEDVIAPAVKTDLVSTNPSTVNLASGDIQLIELFAFW